ncbi:HD domain-containing protein [Methylobacterium organophilum]|uniref:HD-GYP domain-containing protein n=1 Tax=Methylobacterium organophilum TaxID=410 RepID=UPI001F129E5E|nr:HD domain-containing phosphohydrolase [Methylobacterium organophilum]UMY17517.1 HD domain-containing protein [Methylobacterium organophilum]
MSSGMTEEDGAPVVAVVASQLPAQIVQALRGLDGSIRLFTDIAAARAEIGGGAFDLVVIEQDRPSFDGCGLIRALRATETCARMPILFVASTGDPRALRRSALEAGATDILVASADILDLQIRLRNLIALSLARRENERQARAMHRTVERAVAEASAREREIIRRLMLAAEFRDDQAGDHLTRVAGCVIAIAEGLGLSEAEANDIALASTMHDIGKIGIPDTILLKPGPLTDAERQEMQQHALRGFRMLNDSPSRLLQLAAEIALTHHERWDGKGYPQGLSGTEIPLAGRIIAVADVFDALTSARVYKPAWPLEKARDHLKAQAGTHFDPDCVAAFLSRWDDIVCLMEERPAAACAA